MNIGETKSAIMVHRIGGPAQPKVATPKPVEVAVTATETRTLVTA